MLRPTGLRVKYLLPSGVVSCVENPHCDCSGTGTGTGSGTGPSGSGGETMDCFACPDGAAAQFKFFVSGVINSDCPDCNNVNGWWVVTYSGDCCWIGVIYELCTNQDQRWLLCMNLTSITGSGDTVIRLVGGPSLGRCVYEISQTSGPGSTWDCKSPLTIPKIIDSGACSDYPASITIIPI